MANLVITSTSDYINIDTGVYSGQPGPIGLIQKTISFSKDKILRVSLDPNSNFVLINFSGTNLYYLLSYTVSTGALVVDSVDGIVPTSNAELYILLSDLLISVPVTLWQKYSREGRGFTALSGFTTIPNTTETDFLLFKNPVSSGSLVRLKEFLLTIGGTSAQRSIFRFYRNPTITANGTPLTVSKVLSTGIHANVLQVYQTPTISVRGSVIQLFAVDFNTYIRDQDLARFITEGANLLLSVQGSANNIEHNVSAAWAEE